MTEFASHKTGTKGINSHHGISRFFLSHRRITKHKFTALTPARIANTLREAVGKRPFSASRHAAAPSRSHLPSLRGPTQNE